jgi:hypothetical protein
MGLTGTELQPALQVEVGRHLMRGLPKPFPVNPQVFAVVAGRYQDSDGVILTIRVDGRRRVVQSPNQPEYELFARSENQIYLQDSDAKFTFYRYASGEVGRAVLLTIPKIVRVIGY